MSNDYMAKSKDQSKPAKLAKPSANPSATAPATIAPAANTAELANLPNMRMGARRRGGWLTKFVENRIPSGARMGLKRLLDYAGEDVAPEEWLGANLIIAFVTSFTLAFMPYFIPSFFVQYVPEQYFPYLSVAIFVALALVFMVIAYFSLYNLIEARRRKVQKVLPDFLSAVSMNINAGMEPLSALYVSLRPDFDPITSEMQKIRSLALGHKSIVDQLSLLKQNIQSPQLSTTIAVIERATRSGGDLGRLLDSVAADLRETNKLQKELETATRGYVYFISFLILFGVPLLLSVASMFIKFTSGAAISPFGFTAVLGPTFETAQASPQPQGPSVADRIDIVFGSLLFFSAVSAALMLGVLWRGQIVSGVRYAPIFVIVSLAMYFVMKGAVNGIMSSLGIF